MTTTLTFTLDDLDSDRLVEAICANETFVGLMPDELAALAGVPFDASKPFKLADAELKKAKGAFARGRIEAWVIDQVYRAEVHHAEAESRAKVKKIKDVKVDVK